MKLIHLLAVIIALSLVGINQVECKHRNQNLRPKDSHTHAIHKMATRVLGMNLSSGITFNLVGQDQNQIKKNETNYNEYFILTSEQENRLTIKSNTQSGLTRGLYYFMKEYMNSSISWNGDNIQKLDKLPTLLKEVRVQTPYQLRYMLNYCTYSYSMMSFWDWERWEREIDFMALQGINMPLAIIGTSKVWQNTLKQINYTDSEILDFIPGPGFEAWWLMGNLEGYGGPVTQAYIDGQAQLQQKIVKRMKKLGMEPVLQGFYGMVPNSLKAKFPNSKIYGDQSWQGFRRPAFLDANDELFKKLAQVYYQESEQLYGRAKYYGGDPFHEGAVVPELNLTQQAQSIYKAMQFNDDSKQKVIWVLQSWQENPTLQLLQGLSNDECIIIDMMAEARSKWQTDAFAGHNFIWASLPNFGMRIGQYGMIEQYVSQPPLAYGIKNSTMKGIGSIPEGILTNVIDYEILYDMAWVEANQSQEKLTPRQAVLKYLQSFIRFRYGEVNNKNLQNAWSQLTQSIYNSDNPWDGPSESLMLARPASFINKVSSWGTSTIYWNTTNVLEAWKYFTNYVKDVKQQKRREKLKKQEEINERFGRPIEDMESFIELSPNQERNLFKDTFLYDLVDLARQNLASYSYLLYNKVMSSFNQTDTVKFTFYSQQFLELIKDQDKLLSSRKEFLLGHYLEQVQNLGSTEEEKQNFIQQMKRQFTVWSDFSSSLHDYANKEWSGILRDFYLPRWELYFKSLQTYIIKENKKSERELRIKQAAEESSSEEEEQEEIAKEEEEEEEEEENTFSKEDLLAGKNINWFDFEIQFSKNNVTYSSTPEASELEINQEIFQKYYSIILAEHISINQIKPIVQKQYQIRLQPKSHQTYSKFTQKKEQQQQLSSEQE